MSVSKLIYSNILHHGWIVILALMLCCPQWITARDAPENVQQGRRAGIVQSV